MFIPQEGTRFRHRPTGTLFKVKKITSQFVILNSMDGSSQIMTEKRSFTFPFDFEEIPQGEPTPEDADRDIYRIKD